MPPKIVSKDQTYVSPLQQLQTKSGAPAKRIRVSRACDTCRKRKVKCDGKQPCIHCTVYSYECSYNHTRPTPSSTSSSSSSAAPSHPPPKKQKQNHSPLAGPPTLPPKRRHTDPTEQTALLRQLFPEIDALSDNFNADLFITLFEQHKKDGVVDMKTVIEAYRAHANGGTIPPRKPQALDPVEIKIILPPREIALKLIYKTWSESCVLFRFYHRPSFIRDFNSLYETSPTEYSNHQNKMLPLIYSVIAVGALFSKGDNAIDNQYLQDEGYKYFIAARKLIDISNSTDLESIQTIFMLTLFLQCSARLSTCYSYIGIALRSALRQGIHRKQELAGCDNIKAECKKRLFWTIYKMEIYVNSMLGLPNSIDEDDIDVEFPQDVDDVNIDADRLRPQQPGKLSSCGINNSHTKLILILNHIVKRLYKSSNPVYIIPKEVVRNLENELKLWEYELPIQLQPLNNNTPPEYVKANKLLHLDYLHVQIMLYRPFIHYVKLVKQAPTNFGKSFQYECGMRCFQISKQIIGLAREMIQNKLLNGSYWFSVYTIFFSVACLVYYFLEIDNTDTEVKKSIEVGKQILSGLKQRSVSAERIYNLLNHMFENYDRHNIRLQEIQSQRETPQPQPQLLKKLVPQAGPYTQQQQQQQQQTAIPTQEPTSTDLFTLTDFPDINGSANIEDLDMQLFGRFLPSYMLQKPQKSDGVMSESPDDLLSGGSVKTDEHEFDWDRFIGKGEVLDFEIADL